MACELTTGFSVDCTEGSGGIKTLFLAKQSLFQTGVTTDNVTGEVDALPEATLYKYDLKVGLASNLVETLSNEAAGSIAYTQTVNFQLRGLTQKKQTEFHTLAKNQLAVFVQDQNNNIWFIGRFNGARLTTAEGATGTALADFNGYTMAFVAEEPVRAVRLEQYTTTPFDNFADITVSTTQV